MAPAGDWVGDEDCLFLNVFVPPAEEGTENKPVLLYIHGTVAERIHAFTVDSHSALLSHAIYLRSSIPKQNP